MADLSPEELERLKREKEKAAEGDSLVNNLKKAAKDFADRNSGFSYFAPDSRAQEAMDNMRRKRGWDVPKRKK